MARRPPDPARARALRFFTVNEIAGAKRASDLWLWTPRGSEPPDLLAASQIGLNAVLTCGYARQSERKRPRYPLRRRTLPSCVSDGARSPATRALGRRLGPEPDASRTSVASPTHSLNGWPTRYTTRPSAPENLAGAHAQIDVAVRRELRGAPPHVPHAEAVGSGARQGLLDRILPFRRDSSAPWGEQQEASRPPP